MQKTEEHQKLQTKTEGMGRKTQDIMKYEWDKRENFDNKVGGLSRELETLNYTRNNLFSEINNEERILKEKKDE